MSSRVLASARARRAGDSSQSSNSQVRRPGLSINAQAAFAAPQPNAMMSRNNPQMQQYNQQMQQHNQQMQQQMQQQKNIRPSTATFKDIQQQQHNGNPPSLGKLSISDAIGLITIRLGKVEQWVIDTETERATEETTGKTIDNSVIVGLLDRLEKVEKREAVPAQNSNIDAQVQMINNEITEIREMLNSHIMKQSEQNLRFTRDLTETKDLLKSFMLKYDLFVEDVNRNFSDYDVALTELEKSVTLNGPLQDTAEIENVSFDIAEEGTVLTDL